MEARASVQSAEDARGTSVRQQRIEQTARQAELDQSQVDSAKAAQDAALQQSVQADADKNAALRQSAQADADKNVALQQAARSDADKTAALDQADRANAHTEALQAQLLAQFSAVLETRATARGLIVNMTGVLFQNGKATVLPTGREKLAKIAGILSSHKGLMIEADGFTDSTGTADFNLRLSEHRAESARNYLVSQGVPSDAVSFKGFGLENPIASNATTSGRQENRRVELVVSGEGITTAPATGM
jgi:outer membrane protein OmpA-like peptidoglycan-associated protein